MLWTGSDDGLVHVTRDGGASWTNVTPTDLPEWTQVNSLEAHPLRAGRAVRRGDALQARTTSGPTSTRRPTTGRPGRRSPPASQPTTSRASCAPIPTPRACSTPAPSGASTCPSTTAAAGSRCSSNLPIVPVTDLAVKRDDLIAATQGRGFWILDDLVAAAPSWARRLHGSAPPLRLQRPRTGCEGEAARPRAAATTRPTVWRSTTRWPAPRTQTPR